MILDGLNNFQRKIVKSMWSLAFLSIILSAIIMIWISTFDMPTFDMLENPKYDLASIIYDEKGRSFGKYYIENRELIPFDSINSNLVNALISAEDIRFYDHVGIDTKAVMRVISKTVFLRDQSSGGGSTISQQLAKLIFTRPDLSNDNKIVKLFKLIKIKFKEWILAVNLEKRYTKEEIIALYLNKFEFIYGAHGVESASKTYFNKHQKDLNTNEAATIIGMLKNPTLYNPIRNNRLAQERRNLILEMMAQNDKLPSKSLDSLKGLNIDISGFHDQKEDKDPAPYFRTELTKWLKKLISDKNLKKSDGTPYNIYTDGLKIYTTINLDYQGIAEQAELENMVQNQRRYWSVWKGMNPITYEADPNQIEKRKQSIENKIINSDRYQKLVNRYLSGIYYDISKRFNRLQLSDRFSQLLAGGKSQEQKLREAISSKFIEKENRKSLEEFMKSPQFEKFISQYKIFSSQKNKEFNTPVRMKVFAYNKNLEIDTTMTPRDSVIYHMRNLQTSMLVMESGTGKIKAWVGGIGFKYFKFDHVNNRRQVGSTFKPIVYASAISVQGISPCTEFYDVQYSIAPGEGNFHLDQVWSPNNSTEFFTSNKYNLYQGLMYSKNSITIKLMKEMGSVDVIRDVANNMGIDKNKKINGQLLLPKAPSIALGSADLSLCEMTGAYGTFANDGVYTEPYFVTRIEDKNGKVIFNSIPAQKRAINSMYNYIMVDMLKNNMSGEFNMPGVKSEIGGKTGTTNDFADGWFLSITPSVVVGVWVGGDEKWVRYNSLDVGQGFTTARPAVQKFFSKLESDKFAHYNAGKKFKLPADKSYLNLINCPKMKTLRPEIERKSYIENKVRRDQFEEDFD